MRHFLSDSAESYAVGPVDVMRWEQYALGDELPFQAMWYTVAPRSSSPQDCHPEVELSVVLAGTASVEASGRVIDVEAGGCFLLDSEEAHVIHNRTDTPLRVWSSYWMPRETADAAAVPTARAATDDAAPEVTQ
jgi:mannose-6-phosphate isomerase-like protein (cupin superfamily)